MKARLGRTPVEQCAGREALPAELPTMRARPKPVANAKPVPARRDRAGIPPLRRLAQQLALSL